MHLFATFVLLFPVLSESFARSTTEFNSGRPTSRPNRHPTSYTPLTTSAEPVRMTTVDAGDHTGPLFSTTAEQVFEETSTETVTVNHVTTAPSSPGELVCDSTNISVALRKHNESVYSYTLTVCDLNATVGVMCLEFLCVAAADGLNSTKCDKTDTYLQTMYIRKSDNESCTVLNYTTRGGNVLYSKCLESENRKWFLCSDESNSTKAFGQLCDGNEECNKTVIQCTSDCQEDILEECDAMNVSESSSIDYMQHIEVKLGPSSFFISNLPPFTTYEFKVNSTHYNLTSIVTSHFCTTGESIPGMVGDLNVIIEDIHTMTITWKEPRIKNGNLKPYAIVLMQGDSKHEYTESTDQKNYTFENLRPGGCYTVRVAAETEVGQGKFSEHRRVCLPVGEPYLEFHDAIPVPRQQEISTDHFVIDLSNPFSDRNGMVIAYDVIIMCNTTAIPLKLCRAIRQCYSLFYSDNGDHCWNNSLKKPPHPTGVRSNTMVTVGGDKNCRDMEGNCALDPSTTYYVFVRGFTAVDKHTDGPWSRAIETRAKGEVPSDQTNPALVVLIIILVMLTVFAAIIIFILYTRWQNPILRPLRDSRRMNQVALNALPSVTSKPVSAADFTEHVNNLEKDSGLMFTEEFEELKYVGRDQQWEQAELQCNRAKNRFTNILPYDQTRVKLLPLEDVEGSDYINANWIPGFSSKREFIATQGPLPSTKDDFWRLVWEYNCRAVVMLTLCLENGRIKCDQYWPMDSEPLFYGDLQVKIMNETISSSWHIRELQISLGEQSRRIKHFHYLEWPDMKVPDQLSMLAFVQLVRSYVNSRSGGPVVVHCSAGVGRTGTFISLDVLLQQLEQDDVLDVYGIVYRMRMGRVLMVQTEQQYIFIYECMKHVLEKHTQQPHEHVKKEIVYENTNGTETASKSNSEDSNASESESDSSEPCEEQPYEQIQESLDDEGIEDANLC